MPKFRDRSLVPTEVIRLAALGLLAAGPKPYGDLAVEVRHFASRMLGPTLDILGTSIELLRHEGLIEPIGPRTGPGQSLRAETSVQLTEAGRAALHELLTSQVRVPMTDLTRMVVALKLRFLHLLSPEDQRAQFEMLIELSDAELVRLSDLRSGNAAPADALDDWLAQEIAQVQERRAWYARRLAATGAESG
jgi:DNA-binding PadR family transcriptional regulator